MRMSSRTKMLGLLAIDKGWLTSGTGVAEAEGSIFSPQVDLNSSSQALCPPVRSFLGRQLHPCFSATSSSSSWIQDQLEPLSSS